MSTALQTYLDDHLAGASHALDLLEFLKHEHAGSSLGEFLTKLSEEISGDRRVLTQLAKNIGCGSSGLKEAAAWTSEKLSRLKLRDGGTHPLGTFEALEFLTLGVHGKLKLWRALAIVAPTDDRLAAADFAALEAGAAKQEDELEVRRMEYAKLAFLV